MLKMRFKTLPRLYLLAGVFKDEYIHKGARRKLVQELEHKGIVDGDVLKAIGKVPRHFFFPKTFHAHAYLDKAFPIGSGQTISQPYTVAYQTEVLHIHKGDKVLEIGTGSGYQASILMEMGAQVYSVERVDELHKKAAKILPQMGYKPILKLGDGTKGWAEHAPYDKIIVTAGAPVVPNDLVNQLKVGGVMVIPVGDLSKQKMLSVIRTGPDTHKIIELESFAFVPLLGAEGWK